MRCKHMYVNERLPLAGGLIKQTTAAADWSVRLQRICRSQCDYYLIQFLFRQALHKFSGIKCYSIIRIAYDGPCTRALPTLHRLLHPVAFLIPKRHWQNLTVCLNTFFFEIRFSFSNAYKPRTWNFNLPKVSVGVGHRLFWLLRQRRPKISAQYGHG